MVITTNYVNDFLGSAETYIAGAVSESYWMKSW